METFSQKGTWELTFHSQPSRVVKYFVFFFTMDVICVAVLFFCLFLTNVLLFTKYDIEHGFAITLQICMATSSLLSLLAVLQLFSFVLVAFRRLISRKPALLITPSGIAYRDLPAIGNLFLAWSDIASLSVFSIRQTSSWSTSYLCFDPKDHVQFLSRFHPVWRVFVRLGSVATGTLISVPHWYLSEPVEEVLSHIHQHCGDTLSQHHIQVPRSIPGRLWC